MSSLLLFIDPMMYNLVSHYLHMYLSHNPHIAYYNLVSAYCLNTHMSSKHHLYIICTATHGQHGPELSFTVTGICY